MRPEAAARTAAMFALVLATVLSAGATQGRTQSAADVVGSWVEDGRVSGAVLLVMRNGRIATEQAYGWAQLYAYSDGEYGASASGEARPDALRRLDAPRPMNTDTVFDLASVTKVMATTFAAMLLVDDGRLSLDTPVRTYLPDFRGGGKENITARQLLTHRSGLSQWQPIYYVAADADAAYAFIRDFPLVWPVGDERHYSDLGFMLLGRVIESIVDTPLDVFLEQRLYAPLGLEATGFLPRPIVAPGSNTAGSNFAATSHGNPFEHRMVHDADFGYDIDIAPTSWDGWRPYTLAGEVNDGNAHHAFGGVAGHAGLFSTAAELSVLIQVLLNRGESGGHRYLSEATIAEFLTPTGDSQALGWQVPDHLPAGSFHHTGFTGTYVAGIPAEDVVIVLLTNRQNAGLDDDGQYPDIGELQRAVARTAMGSR